MTSLGAWIRRMANPVRKVLRGAQPVARRRGGGLTILTYHLVGAGTGSAVDLPTSAFREHLAELSERRLVVPLSKAVQELLLAVEDAEQPVPHWVAVTFDDGFANFYEQAWPLLEEYRIPATIYTPVGFLEGEYPGPLRGAEALAAMTWEQAREVAAGGLVSVGSHSWSHIDFPRVGEEDLRREILDSRRKIEDEIGRPVEGFCYPRARFSRHAESLVEASYSHAVLAGGRINRPESLRPHQLSRVPVRRDMGGSMGAILESSVWLEEWIASRLRGPLSAAASR